MQNFEYILTKLILKPLVAIFSCLCKMLNITPFYLKKWEMRMSENPEHIQ